MKVKNLLRRKVLSLVQKEEIQTHLVGNKLEVFSTREEADN